MNLEGIHSKEVLEHVKTLQLYNFMYQYLERKIEIVWKTEKFKILKV